MFQEFSYKIQKFTNILVQIVFRLFISSFVFFKLGARLLKIISRRPSVMKLVLQPKLVIIKLRLVYTEISSDSSISFSVYRPNQVKIIDFRKVELTSLSGTCNSLAQIFSISAKDIGISIVVPVYNPSSEFLKKLCYSLILQNHSFSNFEVIFVDDHSLEAIDNSIKEFSKNEFLYRVIRNDRNLGISGSQNVGIRASKKEIVALLDHDDELPEDSLAWLALYAKNFPDAKVFYSDEATIDERSKIISVWSKSKFNRIENQFHNALHHLFAFRKSIISEVGIYKSSFNGAQDFEFTSRCIQKFSDSAFVHIPHVCYFWRSHPGSTASKGTQKTKVISSAEKLIVPNLEKLGSKPFTPEQAKFEGWSLIQPSWCEATNKYQKCSIIIPSRNNIFDLKKCLTSIINIPDPSVAEIIIIDDQSDNLEVAEFYLKFLNDEVIKSQLSKREIELKILCDIRTREQFNFSKLVNFGVSISASPLIVLVNNDLSIDTRNWVVNMSMFIGHDNVGIVGGLLTQGSTLEHAGVVVGANNGLAANLDAGRKLVARKPAVPSIRLNTVRETSAVTGALMAIDRSLFMALGGFNEENLAVEFNDVDFCLRARNLGYRVVINPHVAASHKTSTSRKGNSVNLDEHIFYLKKHFKTQDLFTSPRYGFEGVGPATKKALVSESFFAKMISVKVFLHELSFTGAPIFMLELCSFLKDYGFDFSIYSLVDGPLRKQFEELEFEVYVATTPITPYTSNETDYHSFCEKLDLFENKSNGLAEVFIFNTAICFPLAAVINKHCNFMRNSIFYIHENFDFRKHTNLFLDPNIRMLTLDFCSKNIFLAIFQSIVTEQFYSKLLENAIMVTIPGGTSLDETKGVSDDEAKLALGFEKSDVIISVIGTISDRKNQMALVKALSKFPNAFPSHVKFMLYGGNDSDYCLDLQKVIRKNKLANVIVRQSDSDPDTVFHATNILLSLSSNESYPRVILEALRRQIPIMALKYYGIGELINHQVNGIILETDDSEELTDTILLWLDRTSELNEFAKLGCRDNLRFNNISMLSKYHAHFLTQACSLST